MTQTIAQFVKVLVMVLYFAILARVIVSWLPVKPGNRFITLLYSFTEPMLAPIRRIVPRVGMLDLTPMVALIILWIIQAVIDQAL